MLHRADLAGRRHHDLAYRFFATARWSADQLGLVLLHLICATLVPAGTPLLLAIDDTLWRRSGPRLHGAAWHHDGNGPGRHRPGSGHAPWRGPRPAAGRACGAGKQLQLPGAVLADQIDHRPAGVAEPVGGLLVGQPVDEERAQRLVAAVVDLCGRAEPPGPLVLW